MSEYKAILQKALEAQHGLGALCFSDRAADTLRRKLYETRAAAREAGDHSFEVLSFSISPHSGEILYIYKAKQ